MENIVSQLKAVGFFEKDSSKFLYFLSNGQLIQEYRMLLPINGKKI